jgi:lipopolysaccharide transport system ATP-binding protein
MSDTVIRVENLSKKYIIRHQQAQQYTALRDVIADGVKSIGRRLSGAKQDPSMGSTQEEFWALKDVSFEVKQGDRIGIIGRNGAGKSTLLKILSRIVEPTKGEITLSGRVSSLLEVGTGFHPELTGRENIYLNGAILGMNRLEIRKKFEEIVEFAEIKKFLDTPVKHYSSGMYVRLAFAVAAHLEPDILIIDEVLAVGDFEFQKKCLDKIESISRQDKKTIIFVSHNIDTVAKLCTKAIYLRNGKISLFNNTNTVIESYLSEGFTTQCRKTLIKNGSRNKKVFFKEIAILNKDNSCVSEIDVRYPFKIEIHYELTEELKDLELSVRIDTNDGRPVLTTHLSDNQKNIDLKYRVGSHKVFIYFQEMFLMPGTYLITLIAHNPMIETYDKYEQVMRFSILEMGSSHAKYKKDNQNNQFGVILTNLPWLSE